MIDRRVAAQSRGYEQKITLNGAAFGTITHGYYIYGWFQPGLHTISAEVKTHEAVPTEFEAAAGENYFFRYRSYAESLYIFPVAFYTALHPVDDEDAVYRIQRLKLSAINVFESEKR